MLLSAEQQLEKLADGLKSKQIRISLNQGTILSDLLEYTQKLIKKGSGSSTSSAHKLQAVIQNSSSKEQQSKNPSYTPLIIGGVGIVGLSLLVGYLVGKRKKGEE